MIFVPFHTKVPSTAVNVRKSNDGADNGTKKVPRYSSLPRYCASLRGHQDITFLDYS